MKKQKLPLLIIITVTFAAFTLGLLLGRSSHSGGVTLAVPAPMLTEPVSVEPPTAPSLPATVFPLDLNTATREELMELPGIGEVLAGRILAYREANGAFFSVEELLNIEDIGEKRLEAIVELVRIGG